MSTPATPLPSDLMLLPADAELASVEAVGGGLVLQLSVIAARRPDPDHPLRPQDGWVRHVRLVLDQAASPAGPDPTPGRLRRLAVQRPGAAASTGPWPLTLPAPFTLAGPLTLQLTLVDGRALSLDAAALQLRAGARTVWHETLAC
ncbi:MAG: hypothetical protein RLY78_3833 [Pseudomonadota bacterium]|jgi:hypothetical protein